MLTVEIKGASADRFRAYAVGAMTRKPSREDFAKAGAKGIDLPPGSHIKYEVEHIAAEGAVSLDAEKVFHLDAGDKVISRIVFYASRPDADSPIEGSVHEEVVGSVEVGAGGALAVKIVEPSDEDVVIDASELE